MKEFRISLLFIVLIFSCSKSKKQETLVSKEKTDLEIRKSIDADKKAKKIEAIYRKKANAGFNGSVLVAQKGQVIFKKSYGFANKKDSVLNTPDTRFQLASMSKTFTAIAILKLIEEGKISFENNLTDFYPGLPFSGVSIRSMLSHRSGLPYYQYTFDKKVRANKLYPSTQEIITWFQEQKPAVKMQNKPDHNFAYNNTNFMFLAGIVEQVTGKTFNDYLKEDLLKGLDMNNTFALNKTTDSLYRDKAKGYQWNRELQLDFYDYVNGDKGMYSSVNDLFEWYKALSSNKLLSAYMLQEAYTPRSFENPGIRNYGYGFRLWVNNKQQTEYIYHTGWWKGFNTIMFFDPREDFVIIVLSNVYNRSVYNIRDIVGILNDGKKDTSIEENILDI